MTATHTSEEELGCYGSASSGRHRSHTEHRVWDMKGTQSKQRRHGALNRLTTSETWITLSVIVPDWISTCAPTAFRLAHTHTHSSQKSISTWHWHKTQDCWTRNLQPEAFVMNVNEILLPEILSTACTDVHCASSMARNDTWIFHEENYKIVFPTSSAVFDWIWKTLGWNI